MFDNYQIRFLSVHKAHRQTRFGGGRYFSGGEIYLDELGQQYFSFFTNF